MIFHGHCNTELYAAAASVIASFSWAESYKAQTLDSVVDELEKGIMVRTDHGGHTVPFQVKDVARLVKVVSDRDDD